MGRFCARLARERFILCEPGSSIRLACDAHFERTGFVPDARLEIGSSEAIKEAVAADIPVGPIASNPSA